MRGGFLITFPRVSLVLWITAASTLAAISRYLLSTISFANQEDGGTQSFQSLFTSMAKNLLFSRATMLFVSK